MASCLLERTTAERVTCVLFAETAESFETFCDFGGHLMVMDPLLVLKSYKSVNIQMQSYKGRIFGDFAWVLMLILKFKQHGKN